MPRVLLIMSTTEYKADDFLEACRRVGAEAILATDRCHVLDGYYEFPPESLVIDFYEPDAAVETIVAAARERALAAIVPAGGETAALVAARAATRLGLPANAPSAAEAARNKRVMRERLAAGGVPQPRFLLLEPDTPVAEAAARIDAALGWPCVIKPLLLSASRGVMRVDDANDLTDRLARLRRLLATPELAELDAREGQRVLVEGFVPGVEVALEGILDRGRLRTLAVYDKPDPLDGPFFEETIYVTPSRHPGEVQAAIHRVTAQAAAAMGLGTGPVHAELRLTPAGPVAIEVAARSIGGLCSRMLRFGTGMSLEEVLVRHALGEDVSAVTREGSAAGVLMLPIPRAGVLQRVEGVAETLEQDGVEDVVIALEPGRELVPLPEGASYLGFVFARGATPEAVERTLRRAQATLRFGITPILPAT